MKHVIIGTAGHVDHGKTALIKALTGIDTDRLEEEKRRGVTIEPGFAHLDFDDGTRAGIIDVPGHERFIRNMLAGSGGIDLAMLVIAADEGVMPQTREHLDILMMLGISDGVIVITKTDIADNQWLDLVIDDIKETVKTTFLEGKPILLVSAKTGDGMSELKTTLRKMIDSTDEKNTKLPFRLPVDRVFPVDGFGIVVTGTLIEGSVSTGEIAQVLPSGTKVTVRSIQAHGKSANTIYAGQRTAISLSGVKRGDITRGDVVAAEGKINVTTSIDVKLSVIADTKREIKNGDKLHFYHGARTMLAKVFLIDKTKLKNGESCYARLRMAEPLPCKRKDRFVVRFFSPLETMGGGIILNSLPDRRISRSVEATFALRVREQGSPEEIALLAADKLGKVFTLQELCRHTDIDLDLCTKVTPMLLEQNKIMEVLPGKYISRSVFIDIGKKCNKLMSDFYASNPLKTGMNIAELRQKLLTGYDTPEANAILKELEKAGSIILGEREAKLPGYEASLTQAQSKISEILQTELLKAGYNTKTPDELAALFSTNERKDFRQVLESLISSGEIIILSPQIYWHKNVYNNAVGLFFAHIEKNGTITLAECRDMLETSRKYALAFLEHLDSRKVTVMCGDVRKPANTV